MICEFCENDIIGDYVLVGHINFCPDCFENLTVSQLIDCLGLGFYEGNIEDDRINDIDNFKYRQSKDFFSFSADDWWMGVD